MLNAGVPDACLMVVLRMLMRQGFEQPVLLVVIPAGDFLGLPFQNSMMYTHCGVWISNRRGREIEVYAPILDICDWLYFMTLTGTEGLQSEISAAMNCPPQFIKFPQAGGVWYLPSHKSSPPMKATS